MQVLTVKDPEISVDVTWMRSKCESLSMSSLVKVTSLWAHPAPAGLSWGCSHKGSFVDFVKGEVHLQRQKCVIPMRLLHLRRATCTQQSTNLLRWDWGCCGGRWALGWSFEEEGARHRVCRRLSKTSMSSWGVYREKRRVHCYVKKTLKREAGVGDGWSSYSLLLAVHGQRDVCVIELNVDIVGNQLMKLFHSFSLDKLSGFTPWKQTVFLSPVVINSHLSSPVSSDAHSKPSTRCWFDIYMS